LRTVTQWPAAQRLRFTDRRLDPVRKNIGKLPEMPCTLQTIVQLAVAMIASALGRGWFDAGLGELSTESVDG